MSEMTFKTFNQQERKLIVRMYQSGLRGRARAAQFKDDPIYQSIVTGRKDGARAISNAITNLRYGRCGWSEAAGLPTAAPKAKKRWRPRKKAWAIVKRYKEMNGTPPVPVVTRFALKHCPHCGCPLHGAQEGLRTEQELAGGQ